ncbi:hypothetical protein LSM04_004452 [Trypanosoma melophagium]|uniref:uncharacterized protein n=1 Tax=Trypanosoma melophagium TaxID=715481 RepID=UPI00351A9658|nr:hypothetical protein LSM04_004452 [Trypanosoma melophagium]
MCASTLIRRFLRLGIFSCNKNVLLTRIDLSSSHLSSPAENTNTIISPQCDWTGLRYSHLLERELFRFAQRMKFTSSHWITEKERRKQGLQLCSKEEVPFYPISIMNKMNVSTLMNVVFIEETDLFFFFMQRPLPVRDISHDVHWVHMDGQWRCFTSKDPLYSRLVFHWEFLNRLMLRNRGLKGSSSHNNTLTSPSSQGNTSNSREKSRTCELILPSAFAAGCQAEFFWVDYNAFFSHQLSLFTDAAWVPLHSEAKEYIGMYNFDQIVLS